MSSRVARLTLGALTGAVTMAGCTGAGGSDPTGSKAQGSIPTHAVELVAVTAASPAQLQRTAEAITTKLAGLGVAGSAEVVDGVVRVHVDAKDDARVRELASASTALQFRPVLALLPGTPGPDGTAPPALDDPEAPVTLPGPEGAYSLGPALPGAGVIASASAGPDPQTGHWLVLPRFVEPDGVAAFNAIAGRCYEKAATCPSGQMSIVFGGRVISAPSINAPTFSADQIQIGGSFTEEAARSVADSMNGALPVPVRVKS